MRQAIILDKSDVKRLIAEKFNVDEKSVIQSQYSWIVAKSENESNESEDSK